MFKIIALSLLLLFSIKTNADYEQAIKLGYNSYEEALVALKSNKNSIIEIEDGWITGKIWNKEQRTGSIWIFSSKSANIHPSVAIIELFKKDGRLNSKVKILCEAIKNDCKQFTSEIFLIKNKAMRNIKIKKEKRLNK